MEKHVKAMSDHWVKLLICFLAVLGTSVHGNNVNITILESAVEKGAVCLDGSPPAYYHDQGVGEGVNNWVLFLEGGAWCFYEDDCISRAKNSFGSSTMMPNVTSFSGILSPNQTENPDFYNWNRIYVKYCDGGSFAGEVEEVNPKNNLHFRGARIFNAVVEDLLAKGMKNADNAILSGVSAGGLATILHCDQFRAQVPTAKKLKCLADGGFFIYGKDIPGATELTMARPYHKTVELHGIDKYMPKSCTSRMDAKLCFYPENLVGDIQTPLFIANGAFDSYQVPLKVNGTFGMCAADVTLCNPTQIQLMKGFRTSFLKALPKGDCSSKGMFIDSCNAHNHIFDYNGIINWSGPKATRLKNKTLAEGFGDWYFDRSCFQETDVEHDTPQNLLK